MKRSEVNKLKQLFDQGMIVKIDDSPYVDSNVKDIRKPTEEEQKDEKIEEQDWVYDSEIFEGKPIKRVPVDCVTVSGEMAEWWKEEDIEVKKDKITEEELKDLVLNRGLELTALIDVVIKLNGIIGVGKITLGDQLKNYCYEL